MREIPPLLAAAVAAEAPRHPARRRWLESLPQAIDEFAERWELQVGEPYEPGGRAAWIAPARRSDGEELVLKVGWRHFEAEHEAEALRLWKGDGAVRCLEAWGSEDTIALLLERCLPGTQLGRALPEAEQDLVIADLLRRLWRDAPGRPFRSLEALCGYWAAGLEADLEAVDPGADVGLVKEALRLLRELPASADQSVLLCTDLHAENVLAAEREPWLAVDPKPFVGDPAFDPAQHMVNCDERLGSDPVGLAARMADLLDLDRERLRLWLFTRCAQESLHDASLCEPARRLAASG
jgi:streptomycin 6-kinase